MIKVILADRDDQSREFDFDIEVYDNKLAHDWHQALKTDIIGNQLDFHHQFCFLGFPNTYRDRKYLCTLLGKAINELNRTIDYHIPYDLVNQISREKLNELHNHFEILKGKEWEPSEYFTNANKKNKQNIETLNWVCHELETLEFQKSNPNYTRPSTIMSWVNCPKHDLTDEHRNLFTNWYDSRFGEVYMHWCQIGKTLFEVFNDEGAPELNDAMCEAITELRYYSGEFDINWGRDMTRDNSYEWNKKYKDFSAWLIANGINPHDPKMSLGQMPIGRVKIEESFGTTTPRNVWDILKDHMSFKRVECTG
jgi:hypothetical protein